MIVKTNNIIFFIVFMAMQLVVAFGFQQPEAIQPNVTEMRNNPLKYQDKLVRITGWLKTMYYIDIPIIGLEKVFDRSIETDDDYIMIVSPDMIEPNIFVFKDSLFENFWHTYENRVIYYTCKKDIEVELEGIVKENKEFLKEWIPGDNIQGVFIVTRVIRIEEKYRKPPERACVPDTPDEIFGSFPPVQFDLPRPKLNIEITPPKVIQQPNEKRN